MMEKKIIDMCPNCGSELAGNVCIECGTQWSFLGEEKEKKNE